MIARTMFCFALGLAACAAISFEASAAPKGANGFTADESDELQSLARQVVSKKMKSPIKVVEADVRQYGPSARFAQVEIKISDSRGNPVKWSDKDCQVDYRANSPFAFVMFKRESKRWVAKGTEMCAVENPDWRDVDFQGE